MAEDKQDPGQEPGHNGRNGRIRVIENNTDNEEMMAGHIIPGADPPKNEEQRGGFGNRDGKVGFGSDSSDGPTAVSVNQQADEDEPPKDNMRTDEEGRGT
jgi:hypothetical protein